MDNEISKITLTDENGVEIEFDVITKLDIEENEYVIVVPSNEDAEDAEAVALKIELNDDGEEVLVSIDDEDEFEMVQEAYATLFSEDTGLN